MTGGFGCYVGVLQYLLQGEISLFVILVHCTQGSSLEYNNPQHTHIEPSKVHSQKHIVLHRQLNTTTEMAPGEYICF